MDVALLSPSGWPNIAENNSKIFIDHQLLDAEGIVNNNKL